MEDTSEHIEAMRALSQSESRFRTLVESTDDKIFLIDPSGRITGVYGRWLQRAGLTQEWFTGKTPTELWGEEIGNIHDEAIKKAVKGEQVVYEWAYNRDGLEIDFQESLSPIYGENDSIVGVVSIGRDVTVLKRIEESYRHHAQQLEALYNAGRMLGRTLSLQDNYDALHTSLRKTIPCDGFFISTFDSKRKVIRCEAAWMEGHRADTTQFPEIPLEEEGRGTQSRVIRSGEPLILNDYEATLRTAESVHHIDDEGLVHEEIPEDVDRTRSAMIVPLKLEREVIGVVQVFSYRKNAFTDEHLRLLESMAYQAAAAQNNASLYKRAQEEVAERTRAEQLQNALYRISQTAHTTEGLDELLAALHNIISEVLPAGSFYFALYDSDRDTITFPYYRDEFDVIPSERPPGNGLTEYVLRTGKTYLWRSQQDDPTENGMIQVVGRSAAVWIGVPLIESGRTIGVMAAQHYSDPDAFGEREQQILDFVAAEVTRAITALRAVQAMRESEDKYRSLIENTREGIFLWSDGVFEITNRPFQELVGQSAEVLSSPDFDLLTITSNSDRERIAAFLEGLHQSKAPEPQFEVLLRSADGREFEAEISTNAITYKGRFALQGVVRDISQRRRIEAQLRQTAKLEAIGRLAGGVAHDFNNLLTALTGTAEIMQSTLAPDSPHYRDVEQILAVAKRGSNLTQQLLAFARSRPQQVRVFNLNEVVQNTQQMLRRLIGDNVKLDVGTDPLLPSVKADPAQIEMALMNLVINSRDAMVDGGAIKLETKTLVVDDAYAKDNPGIKPGKFAALSVIDQGHGMPKDVLDRATDPFFTTKPLGKGTGLGLSTVHGIVRQSEGHLQIQSEVGAGTTVTLFLPASEEIDLPEATQTPFTSPLEGRETILVCDDEESVRQVAVRILQAKGYNVLEAADGVKALEVSAAYKGHIDLLLSDMAMPNMGGIELADTLKKVRPGVRVLLMSGYSPMAFPADQEFDDPADFLQKPFRAMELAHRIREMLDRTTPFQPQT